MTTSLLKEQVNRALYRSFVAISSDMVLHDKDKVKLPIAAEFGVTNSELVNGASIFTYRLLRHFPTNTIPAMDAAINERNILVHDLLRNDRLIHEQVKQLFMLSINVDTSQTYSELSNELCRRVRGYFLDFIGHDLATYCYTSLADPDELVGCDEDDDDDDIIY